MVQNLVKALLYVSVIEHISLGLAFSRCAKSISCLFLCKAKDDEIIEIMKLFQCT